MQHSSIPVQLLKYPFPELNFSSPSHPFSLPYDSIHFSISQLKIFSHTFSQFKVQGIVMCINIQCQTIFIHRGIDIKSNRFLECFTYVFSDTKNGLQINDLQAIKQFKSGPDGTRTRDLRRDRAAF